jgi:hypothetical protein
VPTNPRTGNTVRKAPAAKKVLLKKAAVVKKTTASNATVTAEKSTARRGSARWLQEMGYKSKQGDEGGPAWQPSRRADFLVDTLGNKRIATLLGVAESQPSRWRRGEEVPGPQVAPVLVDLDHVVGRLLLLWDASVVGDWLTASNAFLDGTRPIDVLVTRGSAEVLEAIEAETEGAYA